MFLVPSSEANTATAMADEKLLAWLRNAHTASQWTASVCSGALVLAAAGLLEGRPATTHWAAQSALAGFGAQACRDRRIVRSGKIWAATGVSAGIDLALAIIHESDGRDRAELIQLLVEYDPQPLVNSGHPSKARPEIMKKAAAEMDRLSRNPRDLYLGTDRVLAAGN